MWQEQLEDLERLIVGREGETGKNTRIAWCDYNPEYLEIRKEIRVWFGTGLETISDKKKVKSRKSKKEKSRDLSTK